MTYEELLHQIIERGSAAAREDYGRHPSAHAPAMREGSIAGFEACRGKTPAEIVALWREAERGGMFTDDPAKFWFARCRASEIEWTCNVLSAAPGLPAPLLPWLPTARGVMTYAAIVGVAPSSPPPSASAAPKTRAPKAPKPESPF